MTREEFDKKIVVFYLFISDAGPGLKEKFNLSKISSFEEIRNLTDDELNDYISHEYA